MAQAKKTYTPQFKFQVVLEALKNERSDGEIARVYGQQGGASASRLWRFRTKPTIVYGQQGGASAHLSPN